MHRRDWPLRIWLPVFGILVAFAVGTAFGEQAAHPSVDCSKGGRSQLEMNTCAGRDAEAANSRLETLLRELHTSLTPSSVEELRTIQADWARLRERDCQWEKSLFSGGSVAPLVYARCVEARTLERINRLKLFLCEGSGMTGPCEASERY